MTEAITRTSPIDRLRSALARPKNVETIAKLLPATYGSDMARNLAAQGFIEKVISSASKTPKLMDCDMLTLGWALKTAAQLGLEINSPLGHAYLIPYGKQAQLQIGYRGFIALARRSGQISSVGSEIVYEQDQFKISLGTHRDLLHVPDIRSDRGAMIGAYATVLFKDGTTDFEYMTADEIGAIRKRSLSGNSGPWVTDTTEMWRKTPLRRLVKRLPMASEESSIVAAAVTDEEYDFGVGAGALPEASSTATIATPQRMEIVNAAKASGNDVTEVLRQFGFDLLADVTVDVFPDVLLAASLVAQEIQGDLDNEEAIEGEAVFEDVVEGKVEDLRSHVEEIYSSLPTGRQKDLIEGRPSIGKMTGAELEQFLAVLKAE